MGAAHASRVVAKPQVFGGHRVALVLSERLFAAWLGINEHCVLHGFLLLEDDRSSWRRTGDARGDSDFPVLVGIPEVPQAGRAPAPPRRRSRRRPADCYWPLAIDT